MSKNSEKVKISIDNVELEVAKGITILQAAQQHNIYIPTLCAHEDLTPFGGCRMCIVEVDGMRGFPTACTTPVEDGMVIQVKTAQIQEERREILQLILSEHTSSCLICDEKYECGSSMGTIRKTGVTTGCRFCPNDHNCELQDVVEYLDLKSVNYPIYYRGLRVEKEDPFYDRDYNLCILCGRCIRICQEVRAANTLSFKQRGGHTVIGPAFNRTHLEAGCEFCGACVSVCPTGALSEKVRKWEGELDRTEITTCALCGVGCQIQLLMKKNRVIGSLPADEPLINGGHLCVKGRFCIPELVNNYRRVREPLLVRDGGVEKLTWKRAVETAAKKLSECPPEKFGMLISPNCCNEDLYVGQKFTRFVMNSPNIDTSARIFYGAGFNAYLDLMRSSVPLSSMAKASVILCLGLDAKYGHSVVGVEIREAIKNGAKIITVNLNQTNLSVIADEWLQPSPGKELEMIRAILQLLAGTASSKNIKGITSTQQAQITSIAEILAGAKSPMIIVGSDYFHHQHSPLIFKSIKDLAESTGAGVLPLPPQSNLYGSIRMGAYPEFLPGGYSSISEKRVRALGRKYAAKLPGYTTGWNARSLAKKSKLKVLYVIGEAPASASKLADYVIFQNIYPPPDELEADLILPSTAFTETDGTFFNGEGRLVKLKKSAMPPGNALPNWAILGRIAQKMGKKESKFSSIRQIQNEMADVVEGFALSKKSKRTVMPLDWEGELQVVKSKTTAIRSSDAQYPFLLYASVTEHTYSGYALTEFVDGAKQLFREDVVNINSNDAEKAGIADGDEVEVSSDSFQRKWITHVLNEQTPGTLYVTLRHGDNGLVGPYPVKVNKTNV